MLATLLKLAFQCSHCGEAIGVTLKCEGVGLANPDAVVRTEIHCPFCAETNEIFFAPEDGSIHRVARARVYCRVPAMSIN